MAENTGSPDGVEFEQTEDGRVAAHHADSGVTSYGESELEAAGQLAEALNELKGGGCPELWEYMSEYREQE